MYVIITYDVGEKRVYKVCKKLREYLTWTQNSVFEGQIGKGKLTQCMHELDNIIHPQHDSIYLYQVNNQNHMKKTVFGREKGFDDLFL
ncbi:CRISPR-associated endonuclease Cas2 [Kroppenstedtia eburnea]|uniref:CRISPR-associated endoribonuclease Cas2 n=1 Tax=Kroppenstedtia eburnea TaxID=714067 RepID=A0A1N7Q439_9BACL|nr:CRISPR-associated endonuclease Cas2 [Kroppenstedtia eburnea]QKI82605.1 CRISPR-associated endonuclease Cas2 [Kroppenstedtia eburnea]SIT17613.1 CRISPR-associated protein Cas2 [Kroppenstedtia eburnea]